MLRFKERKRRNRSKESPDSKEQGTRRKPGLVIAGIQTFYPHVKFGTDFELTKSESHRDEWK